MASPVGPQMRAKSPRRRHTDPIRPGVAGQHAPDLGQVRTDVAWQWNTDHIAGLAGHAGRPAATEPFATGACTMAHGHCTSHHRSRPRHGAWLLAIALLALALLGGCASEQELRLSALHFFRQGNEAMAREDYPLAIRHYQRVIDLDDSVAAARYNLGLAYFAMMEYEAAADAFQTSLELEPNSAAAHYNLALTYDRLYNLPLAHRHYNTYRRLAQEQVAQREPEAATATQRPAAQAGTARDSEQQATQPAKPAESRAAALQTTTATAKRQATPRRPASTSGGNQKWWIQDRFIQRQ